jgi:hypothetical protein
VAQTAAPAQQAQKSPESEAPSSAEDHRDQPPTRGGRAAQGGPLAESAAKEVSAQVHQALHAALAKAPPAERHQLESVTEDACESVVSSALEVRAAAQIRWESASGRLTALREQVHHVQNNTLGTLRQATERLEADRARAISTLDAQEHAALAGVDGWQEAMCAAIAREHARVDAAIEPIPIELSRWLQVQQEQLAQGLAAVAKLRGETLVRAQADQLANLAAAPSATAEATEAAVRAPLLEQASAVASRLQAHCDAIATGVQTELKAVEQQFLSAATSARTELNGKTAELNEALLSAVRELRSAIQQRFRQGRGQVDAETRRTRKKNAERARRTKEHVDTAERGVETHQRAIRRAAESCAAARLREVGEEVLDAWAESVGGSQSASAGEPPVSHWREETNRWKPAVGQNHLAQTEAQCAQGLAIQLQDIEQSAVAGVIHLAMATQQALEGEGKAAAEESTATARSWRALRERLAQESTIAMDSAQMRIQGALGAQRARADEEIAALHGAAADGRARAGSFVALATRELNALADHEQTSELAHGRATWTRASTEIRQALSAQVYRLEGLRDTVFDNATPIVELLLRASLPERRGIARLYAEDYGRSLEEALWQKLLPSAAHACVNALRGDSTSAALWVLSDSMGVIDTDEARIERTLRALSDSELTTLRARLQHGNAWERDVQSALEADLGGHDLATVQALLRGDRELADAVRLSEAIEDGDGAGAARMLSAAWSQGGHAAVVALANRYPELPTELRSSTTLREAISRLEDGAGKVVSSPPTFSHKLDAERSTSKSTAEAPTALAVPWRALSEAYLDGDEAGVSAGGIIAEAATGPANYARLAAMLADPALQSEDPRQQSAARARRQALRAAIERQSGRPLEEVLEYASTVRSLNKRDERNLVNAAETGVTHPATELAGISYMPSSERGPAIAALLGGKPRMELAALAKHYEDHTGHALHRQVYALGGGTDAAQAQFALAGEPESASECRDDARRRLGYAEDTGGAASRAEFLGQTSAHGALEAAREEVGQRPLPSGQEEEALLECLEVRRRALGRVAVHGEVARDFATVERAAVETAATFVSGGLSGLPALGGRLAVSRGLAGVAAGVVGESGGMLYNSATMGNGYSPNAALRDGARLGASLGAAQLTQGIVAPLMRGAGESTSAAMATFGLSESSPADSVRNLALGGWLHNAENAVRAGATRAAPATGAAVSTLGTVVSAAAAGATAKSAVDERPESTWARYFVENAALKTTRAVHAKAFADVRGALGAKEAAAGTPTWAKLLEGASGDATEKAAAMALQAENRPKNAGELWRGVAKQFFTQGVPRTLGSRGAKGGVEKPDGIEFESEESPALSGSRQSVAPIATETTEEPTKQSREQADKP